MGFFDSYKDEGGLSYVGAEERIVFNKNKTPFPILRVWHGEGQYGPKYTLVIELDGEERALSFGAGKVESRDRMLDAMIEYLDTEDEVEFPKVVLTKVKQSWILVNAEKTE